MLQLRWKNVNKSKQLFYKVKYLIFNQLHLLEISKKPSANI